jgi:hypothetical protein
MKVIVFVDPVAGGTSVFYPNYDYKRDDETEEEFLARTSAKAIPSGVATHIIENTEIPSDRYFRDAWEWED